MADTVLGTCKYWGHAAKGHHAQDYTTCVDWVRSMPWELKPKTESTSEPIPPLLLQAYRALKGYQWMKTAGDRQKMCDEAIAAIEAAYPGVKEKA